MIFSPEPSVVVLEITVSFKITTVGTIGSGRGIGCTGGGGVLFP